MAPVLSIAFTALLAALGVFQLVLAAGAPFGRLAWGGQHAVLPRRLRVGSVVAVLLYAVFAVVALERAGISDITSADTVVVVAMWVIAVYLVLGIVPNLASKSPAEKRVMVPVSATLAVLALLIAIG